MPGGSWDELERIFLAAMELAPGDRERFLDEECAHNPWLRAEVLSLLGSHDSARDFLEAPAAEHIPPVLLTDRPERRLSQRVGPYELRRLLASGGMGHVYLAERIAGDFEQQVAIKLVRSDLRVQETMRRFLRERRALAGLVHQNIARLLDGGTTEDGLPYLVMEYVDGKPIDAYCDEHRLPTRKRLELFLGVCAAVQCSHQHLVVHRDLKPSNILVTAEGVPKVLDFGIAKILRAELASESPTTTVAQRRMTLPYASPEQIRGEPVTTASDVYSLGVVLFELLTGRSPYRPQSWTPVAVEKAIFEQDPPRPSAAVSIVPTVGQPGTSGAAITAEAISALRDGTPEKLRGSLAGDVDNIAQKAMAKEPTRRYGSVAELAADIRRHLEGLPVTARPSTFGYRAAKLVRRHRGAVLAGALAMLALLAGVVMTTWQWTRAVTHLELAREARRVAAEQAARARDEAETAERISEFLVELFEVADPTEKSAGSMTVQEILDRGASRIGQALEDQPRVRSALLITMGRVYRNLGLYDRATPLLQEALTIQRASPGADSVSTVSSLTLLGSVHRFKGDYAAAEPLLLEALGLIPRAGTGNSRARNAHAEALSELGSLMCATGQYDAAESLLVLAVEITQLGGDSLQTANSRGNLAEVLRLNGDYAAADSLFREVLETFERGYGPEHANVAPVLSDLGSLREARGDFAGAEALYRRALNIDRRNLPPDHLGIATSLNNLAGAVRWQGRLAEAESLYGESLGILKRNVGPAHPDIAASLNNLAGLLAQRGDHEGSGRLLREAVSMWRQLLGNDHPLMAMGLANLAWNLLRRGRLDEAERRAREAIEIQEKTLPEDHPQRAITLTALGEILMERGDLRGAEKVFLRCLVINRKAAARGSYAEGLLGECLARMGRHAEAESLVISSFTKLHDELGADHAQTQEARARVVALYEAWGKPGQADQYRSGVGSQSPPSP